MLLNVCHHSQGWGNGVLGFELAQGLDGSCSVFVGTRKMHSVAETLCEVEMGWHLSPLLFSLSQLLLPSFLS